MDTPEILLAILGSSVLVKVLDIVWEAIKKHKDDPVQKIASRLDKLEKKINERLDTLEKASLRTQMLILMNHYPEESYRLMECAKKYFNELNGDWWMSGLFVQHCDEHHIVLPPELNYVREKK